MNAKEQESRAAQIGLLEADCRTLRSASGTTNRGCLEPVPSASQGDRSGVIPYRFRGGMLEVLLITSRLSGRWIIPKGRIQEDLGPAESAAVEAFEEAGVRGILHPACVGSYVHQNERDFQHVKVFLLAVETVLEHWPEERERQRLWCPFEYASKRVQEPELGRIILGLPKQLQLA